MFVEEAVKKSYQRSSEEGNVYLVAQDFPAFEGHFEGRPILPAVCQLSFCADSASRYFERKMQITSVKRAKFINPILPNALLEVQLKQRPDGYWLGELLDYQTKKKFSQIILQFSER